VFSSLIMNVDERNGKWMHGSTRLHPFRRSVVLRGMNKLQTPAIEALELRKRYRDGTEVLRGVSFAVEPERSSATSAATVPASRQPFASWPR